MSYLAALAPGLAVQRTAQGAQNNLPTAGRRPPVLYRASAGRAGAAVRQPPAFHRLRAVRSYPPTPSRSAPPPTSIGPCLSTCARGG
jgi:hypothetical protein